jgi:uncharacterized protein YebE (UPF0316 family)
VNTLIDLVAMTGLATISVSLWTLRVAVTAKGLKTAAATIAALEAMVFVLAFSRAITGLTAPGRLAAYGVGVGLGTLVGLAVDRRLNRGHAQVEVVAPEPAPHLAAALHRRGWPTTSTWGEGLSGRVILTSVTVDEDQLPAVLDDVARLAPDAFWTVRTVRAARAVPLPGGLVQISRRRTPERPPRPRLTVPHRRGRPSISPSATPADRTRPTEPADHRPCRTS